MTLLVTGGAGYIGSHLVHQLIAQGREVVVFDNLSTGHREAVAPGALLIEGDLRDQDQVESIFRQHIIEGIFHFASNTLVGESTQKPWLYLRDNVIAAANLLETAVTHGVGRIVFSSTSNLFDQPARIPIDEHERIVPGSPYGESKAMIERQLYWMDRLYGLKYCALRYFNAAGAHPNGHLGEDHTPEFHLVPTILQVALGQRDQLTIYGTDYDTPDGTCIRDFVHVVDLAEAHLLAYDALSSGHSSTYNLGSEQGYSVQQVINLAREITGCPIAVEIGARRLGDPARLIADSSTIRHQLGWQPQYHSLDQIIQTAWNWHRHHPQGYATSAALRG